MLSPEIAAVLRLISVIAAAVISIMWVRSCLRSLDKSDRIMLGVVAGIGMFDGWWQILVWAINRMAGLT